MQTLIIKIHVKIITVNCTKNILVNTIKNSEYDQEIPQSQTAEKPMAPPGRAKQQS